MESGEEDEKGVEKMKRPVKSGQEQYLSTIGSLFNGPVTMFRKFIVEPLHERNQSYYYHRKYWRVPEIDSCYDDDFKCIYEANVQFKRDLTVESNILSLLRLRMDHCMKFYDKSIWQEKCQSLIDDYYESRGNFFTKYGELGHIPEVRNAFMKQKHRMIWERRHGPIGTGPNPNWQPHGSYTIQSDSKFNSPTRPPFDSH